MRVSDKIRAYISSTVIIALASLSGPAGADEIRGSSRSRGAQKRVRPRLEPKLIEMGLSWGSPIFVRIFKAEKQLEVWLEGKSGKYSLVKIYPICTYSGRLGPKLKEGDFQAPEGFYFVTPGRLNPYSRYHLSFNLGYPNRYDRVHGRTGSALMVHGNCVSIGCFAMTNVGIEEIYTLAEAALSAGQPFFRVHVFPFRMNEQNLKKYQNKRWASFWLNLQEGYDAFEKTKSPPKVEVKDGRYVFETG